MKHLYLMHHGEPKTIGENRTLTLLGRAQTQEVVNQIINYADLSQERMLPRLVIASPRPRTLDTATVFLNQLNRRGHHAKMISDFRLSEIEINNKTTPYTLFDVLKDIDEKYSSTAIVGHQAQMGNALFLLTGRRWQFNYSYAALVTCNNGNWAQAATFRSAKIAKLFRPGHAPL